jgi:protein TonB
MPHLDLANSREPEYPPQSRQLGEQGSVVLQVLVGADGSILDSKLVQGSGYDRLDQAALRDIKRGYRFVAGTIDGKPQPMWYTIKYNWKLR